MMRAEPPAVPPGWKDAAGALLRIADPAGDAVAWVAPGHGANAIGFAVRYRGGWAQVLHSAGPQALAARPTRYGCPLLCPFPGLVPGARYTWRGRDYSLPPNLPDGRSFAHGFAHLRPWHVIGSSPDAVTAEFVTPSALTAAERAGYPFAIRLRLTGRLVGGALLLGLEATNEGPDVAPVGLGLHPYFDPAFLADDRARLRAMLPGRAERLLAGAYPTGETRPVAPATVALPPAGEMALLSRTALGHDRVATLMSAGGGPRVALTLEAGCRDLLLYAPAEQPSVALEPLSCAPSAAARAEGDAAGLMGLDCGELVRLAVSIAVVERGEES